MATQSVVLVPKTSDDFESAKFIGKNGYNQDVLYSDTGMRNLHSMISRYGADGITTANALDNFNRFYNIFPDMEMPQDFKSYVFITRPDLNLLEETANSGVAGVCADNSSDGRLRQMMAHNPEILQMLTGDYSSLHDFIPYLQSRAMSMQIPDYEIRTSELTVPFYNYKFSYPTVTNESTTGGSFNIGFHEDNELRITKLFQFWIYYQDAVAKNIMKPKKEYIYDGTFDYMCSIYQIICDPSSERILYWVKYTGCYPTGVPISNFSHNVHSTVDKDVSINFQYSRVEALEPTVISDFMSNLNSRVSTAAMTQAPAYNAEFGITGESLVSCPYIEESKDQHCLLLKWIQMMNGKSSTISETLRVYDNFEIADSNAALYTASSSSSATSRTTSSTTSSLSSVKTYDSDSI